MLYIIHDEQVQCAVLDPRPIDPADWTNGTILRFKTLLRPLPEEIDYTILTSMSGLAWHLEILGRSKGLGGDEEGEPIIAAKVLRRLKADDEMLVMIRDFCRGLPFASQAFGEAAAASHGRGRRRGAHAA